MNDLEVQAFKQPTWNDYYNFCVYHNFQDSQIVGIETFIHCKQELKLGKLSSESIIISKA